MATTTPLNGWSIPELTDPANITQLNTLANAIDQRVVPIFASVSSRSAAFVTPTEGQMCYVTGTKELYIYNGTAWVGARPRTAYATADQGVTNNDSILVASTYLTLPLEANSIYELSGSLRWHSTTFANDIRIGTNVPVGVGGYYSITTPYSDDTFSVQPAIGYTGSRVYGNASANLIRAPIQGALSTAATAGSLTITFCEGTDSVGLSTATLNQDSLIKLLKIA